MNNVIVFGGAGYTGNVLVPKLLANGWHVTVYDTFWFGDFLPKNENLKKIKGDIRDIDKVKNSIKGNEFVLHLSCISNDASFELDENISTSINLESFEPVVIAAKNQNVKRFVFASSSSVYGISEKKDVKEDHPLVPLTLYNKYKGMCEPLLLKHASENFKCVIFRPATVCGYSPRLRLDLSVNILTNHAISNKKILVFGGNQMRPNLHIDDYSRVCIDLLKAPNEKIENQIFNVGMQNHTILEIAEIVKNTIYNLDNSYKIDLEIIESDDNRSYHINSDKIKNILGFVPKKTIQDAVTDLFFAFKKGLIKDSFENDDFYNVKTIKKLHQKNQIL